ncbi:DNA-directed RNA polymerase III subunit 2-like isoform X2 [Apium graveolens]|uniref:DNA-directed RNA polymerase III subunit 2-like isoform X2 n=1 Tax=Apium graveolens TaxID=4045 RepID=UPI003D7A0558
MEKRDERLKGELNPLVRNYAETRKVAEAHISSYDRFLESDMQDIVKSHAVVRSRVNEDVYMRFRGATLTVGRPSTTENPYVSGEVTPMKCRLTGSTYSAPLFVDIEFRNRGGTLRLTKQHMIGKIPLMLKSKACPLRDLNEEKLIKHGECPLDPGGFFIIQGQEKVLLIREELARNKIFIGRDEKDRVQATVWSRTRTMESAAVLVLDDGIVYLSLSQFSTEVPVMVVFKAMGMELDSEIRDLVGPERKYLDKFELSVQDCKIRGIKTQKDALKFLEVRKSAQGVRALDILREIFLCHLPVVGNNFSAKCIFVAFMVKRMVKRMYTESITDDLNYVGNRRLELPGDLLSLLFEDLFKKMSGDAIKFYDSHVKKSPRADVFTCINRKIIFKGLEFALSTGNWNIKRWRMHLKGMTQVVPRFSFIATLSSLRRILPQDKALQNVTGCRSLHSSQYGMFCPVETPHPQGDACGLVKHLALMTDITFYHEESSIISRCRKLGVEDVVYLSGPFMQGSSIVFLNGSIIGMHPSPKEFIEKMRQLRRRGEISFFISIFLNEKQHCIYIASDGGRVCRPLIIADKGVSKMEEKHMESLKDGSHNLESFLKMGLIEFLDVDEENNALIALCEKDATSKTTHFEIEQFAILGVCAGLMPFVNHNESRNNSAAKLAMGNIAYNQLHRTDKQLNLLVYPQRPLLTTQTGILVGYDKLGGGENSIVAIMPFEGYNTKEAIVMNKASIDRGLSRCMVIDRLTSDVRTGPPEKSSSISLDDYGIPYPGRTLERKDIYFNERVQRNTTAQRPRKYKGPNGQIAVVDRVVLTYNTEFECLCFRLMTHQTRRTEVGDKFSRRDGKKGVCGDIAKQEDLPFSERGICPDLILNTSDNVVSMLLEILAGKAGASEAKLHSDKAYTHGRENIEKTICETLVKHGFSYSGKDFMYSGTLGSPVEAYIMMGPLYVQKSKHMVMDKMRVFSKKSLKRKQYEGARLGEKDRDCLVAYGASMSIHERLMVSADSVEVQVCNVCGLLGYFDYKLKTAVCSTCKSRENMSVIKMPNESKLLLQELQSMNIVPRLKLTQA